MVRVVIYLGVLFINKLSSVILFWVVDDAYSFIQTEFSVSVGLSNIRGKLIGFIVTNLCGTQSYIMRNVDSG